MGSTRPLCPVATSRLVAFCPQTGARLEIYIVRLAGEGFAKNSSPTLAEIEISTQTQHMPMMSSVLSIFNNTYL